MTGLPFVSVVVPMLDEMGAIERCLDGFAGQTYPTDRFEVLVVDGGSKDGSRAYVDGRGLDEPWIRVVENPERRASAAFNAGIDAARGEVLCLFSAHGVPGPDYLERSVDALEATGAAGVGGMLEHEGEDRRARAIGLAMVSPVGMASPFRFATTPREVDTIGHPAYVLDQLRSVGRFDTSLERNSDYEMNWRLRDAGLVLWFDPSIVTVYRPRSSVATLRRQFWWYGRWKERVIRLHPRSLRARHLVPPAAVLGLGLSPLLLTRRSGRRAVGAAALGYVALVAAGVVHARPTRHDADPVVLAMCFPVMHISWGAGFLASAIEDVVKPPSPRGPG